MNIDKIDLQLFINNILKSRKYRNAGLNRETVRDLILKEAPKYASEKTMMKAVRRKLHNIVAPYLGEPDYSELTERLEKLNNPSLNSSELQKFCREALSGHVSTRERLPLMTDFYEQLFQRIGKPDSLLDLACGLHPLAFPWMSLPFSIKYHAYDIIQPRVDFINHYFSKIGITPLAENRDVLINPPLIQAEVGLFFKEAHRFEKREPGCNRKFWESVNVDTLVVSLPAKNLSGTHDLTEQQRQLVHANLPEDRRVYDMIIANELIFIIEKS